MADVAQRAGRDFDQRRRAARENARTEGNRKTRCFQHRPVDAAGKTAPARRLHSCERVHDFCVRLSVATSELGAVDDVLDSTRGIKQRRRRVAIRGGAMAQHGHQWHDAGAACDEEKVAIERGRPNKIAANRPAQFEVVPLCVPKTLSALFSWENRLTSAHNVGAALPRFHFDLAIQVEKPT